MARIGAVLTLRVLISLSTLSFAFGQKKAVTLRNVAVGRDLLTTKTDATGRYVFKDLDPGFGDLS